MSRLLCVGAGYPPARAAFRVAMCIAGRRQRERAVHARLQGPGLEQRRDGLEVGLPLVHEGADHSGPARERGSQHPGEVPRLEADVYEAPAGPQ